MNKPVAKGALPLPGGMELHEDCILVKLQAKDAEDVLRQLAERLSSRSCTYEGFCEALLARERDYPTGIPTKTLAVAIPHAEPEFVRKPSLAVAVLDEGVAFRQLDDHDQVLSVRLVFLVALPEAHGHIEFLRRFALALQTNDFLPALLQANDASTVCEIVTTRLATVDETDGDHHDDAGPVQCETA